ncbi:MAG: hypothetical protein GXZ11_03790 [Tissierellia bacterium]|nr:hypothetical protein [Tissierellia bacterium]
MRNRRKPKKKMKTANKLVVYVFVLVTILQIYCLYEGHRLHSELIISVVAGSAFTTFISAIVGYLIYKLKLNTKAMEIDYDPDYDLNNNLY